jgi:hypothetical protein
VQELLDLVDDSKEPGGSQDAEADDDAQPDRVEERPAQEIAAAGMPAEATAAATHPAAQGLPAQASQQLELDLPDFGVFRSPKRLRKTTGVAVISPGKIGLLMDALVAPRPPGVKAQGLEVKANQALARVAKASAKAAAKAGVAQASPRVVAQARVAQASAKAAAKARLAKSARAVAAKASQLPRKASIRRKPSAATPNQLSDTSLPPLAYGMMLYKSTGAIGIRQKGPGGRQVMQVLRTGPHTRALAAKCVTMLAGGSAVERVKAWLADARADALASLERGTAAAQKPAAEPATASGKSDDNGNPDRADDVD